VWLVINDISGLGAGHKMANIISHHNAGIVLMHMKGTPEIMQKNPCYEDVCAEVLNFLSQRVELAEDAGIDSGSIAIDPGIGFGKNLDHNLRLMSKISIFHSLGCPILIGTSRKRFIEHIVTKFDTPDRTGGTLASVLHGLSQGVQLFRVHNVKEINQGILVFDKILKTN